MSIHERLARNRYHFDQTISNLVAKGSARNGQSLLPGLAYCGHCGARMHVRYRDREGLRYMCDRARKTFGDSLCSDLQGKYVDEAVCEAFFKAVEPAEIALLDDVLAAQDADQERVAAHHRDQIKGAEYEARLAERHYRAVDPDNRLVASELEKGWEAALQTLSETREAAERFERERHSKEAALDPAFREQLLDLGKRMPELWDSGRLAQTHKKELLRSLIERVILFHPAPEYLEVRIVWVSGAVPPLTVPQTLVHEADLSDYDLLGERTLQLAKEGYRDRTIASVLTEEGFRTARSISGVQERFVGKLRRSHGVTSLARQSQLTGKFEGKWTVTGLGKELGIHNNWLYRWVRWGELPAERSPKTGHYLIEDTPEIMRYLRKRIEEHPKL